MYFVANWKMFGGLSSLKSLNKVITFFNKFKHNKYTKIIYCPPSTLIYPMSRKLKTTRIEVGAQNCHQNNSYGAFTGSINSMMLKNVGAKYVIVGHSENRQIGENNSLINLKIKSALHSGLKVILCIGETLQERRKKKTNQILTKQIKFGLQRIKNTKNVIIAYEPVWAIGTGIIPKTIELFKTIKFIKSKNKKYKVLYGGSVNSQNIQELKSIDNLDGFLVGGASQYSKKFIDIIKKTFN